MATITNDLLERLDLLLQEACASSEMETSFDGSSAPDLVRLMLTAGQVQRRLDAIVAVTTGAVQDRDHRLSDERVSTAAGCRDVTELLRRALRVDTGTARRYVHAARAVHRDVQLSTGEPLPAKFEAMRAALRDGVVSVTGLLAAVGPVERAGNRIGSAEREAVDRILADAARGLDQADEQGRPGPAPSTDELADIARALMLVLDPDGAEPDDDAADRGRSFRIGRLNRGLHPVSGGLLPEVAGQLQRLLDALNNPAASGSPSMTGKVAFGPDDGEVGSPDEGREPDDGVEPGDPDALPDPEDFRTPAQRNHDNLAAILGVAAASGGMPELGGAAPTLVVSVSAEDYAVGTGRAVIEGTRDDVPLGVARHIACAGGIQRVLFDEHGQIVSIGTTARIFNAAQRRAITLRDRECVIPGCHIPATWCELHHVREWADGGPTHTSNGVALCWNHHRTLETSGWHIRMRQGVPEIRGPHWWDPYARWHRPRTHAGAGHGARRMLADALAPPGG
ncbi:HNH endonuclease signature motif containing protein [Microbacterium panaciterrae]|uniref:HNH endonuclease signature motif containing protein n=1 Tax=Microbacterium panaciterrae TaxID=985759 RepID=A0ABP8P4F6_9MICO